MRASAACILRILALSLAAFGAVAGPSAPQVRAQSLQARLFDQDTGLGSPSITSIAQDRHGYLWIATENGLFQYSGSYFEEFGRAEGLTDPAIYSLVVDQTGTVWAGAHGGLYWYGGRRFHEVQYQGQSLRVGMNSMLASTAAGELIVQTAKATLSVTRTGAGADWSADLYSKRHPEFPHIADSNGVGANSRDELVIGCDEAICEGSRVLGPQQGVPADYYMGIYRARDGSLWARGRKHIVTWRTGDAQVRDLSSLFPANAMHTVWRRFTEDAAGNILTPTAEGFATWNGAAWSETTRTSRGPLRGATALLADREGSLWIGTEGSGMLQSPGYGKWSNYDTADGLAHSYIGAIGMDLAGQLWVGGNQAATLLPRGGRHFLPTPLAGRDEAIDSQAFAATPDGGMWTGSLTGQLTHTDAMGRVDMQTSLDTYVQKLLLDQAGTLWMGASSGLFRVQCMPRKPCTPEAIKTGGLAGESVRDIVADGAQGLWLAGAHGLDHLDLDHLNIGSGADIGSGAVTHVSINGQKQAFRHLARAGADSVWLAGETAGLIRVEVDGKRGKVVEVHTRPELLSDRVQFLETDQAGRLWIGTDHGVNALSNGRFSGVTTEDGLSSNDATAFQAAGDGTVWIGTTQGISHLLEPEAALSRGPFQRGYL